MFTINLEDGREAPSKASIYRQKDRKRGESQTFSMKSRKYKLFAESDVFLETKPYPQFTSSLRGLRPFFTPNNQHKQKKFKNKTGKLNSFLVKVLIFLEQIASDLLRNISLIMVSEELKVSGITSTKYSYFMKVQ